MAVTQLKIGVLIKGPEVTPWTIEFLRRLRKLAWVGERSSLELVVIDFKPNFAASCSTSTSSSRTKLSQLFFRGLLWLDSLRTRRFRERRSLREVGAELRVLSVATEQEATQLLDGVQLVVDLVGLPLAELRAEYGVWRVNLGEGCSPVSVFAGCQELIAGKETSEAQLKIQLNGQTLMAGRLPVRTHQTSFFLNQAYLARGGLGLMYLALRSFFECNDKLAYFRRLHSLTSMVPEVELSLGAQLRAVLLVFERVLSARGRSGTKGKTQWSFGVVRKRGREIHSEDLREVAWYNPGRHHFVADPFVFEHQGVTYLFVEEYEYLKRRGHISCCEVRKDGSFSELKTVLTRDFHLSFPLVFRDGGRIFMLPEQSASNRVVLYEAVEFPYSWEERAVLLEDFPGVDNVIFRRDGIWWLYSTFGAFGCQDCNLNLFFSQSLTGPYQSHPQNPVSLSLRGSRMAGGMMMEGAQLTRVGQNCVRRYGGSVVIYDLEILSAEQYLEKEVREILPPLGSPFGESFHTINSVADFSAVTGMRFVK